MSHNPPNPLPIPETEAMRVLHECISVMRKKAADYQSTSSDVKQAEYYPHGIQSLYDMVNTKRLRVKSVMDKMRDGGEPNHESLEDSLKDLINYASFSVAWLRGKIDGQDSSLDPFNRPKKWPVVEVSSLPKVSNNSVGWGSSDFSQFPPGWPVVEVSSLPKVSNNSVVDFSQFPPGR